MVCGHSTISHAFGFSWSSHGCISFLGPQELLGLHHAGCAVGYLMVPPNKCEVSMELLRLQATARENFKNAVGQIQQWQCAVPKNVVFSLGQKLLPDLGYIPKQPDSAIVPRVEAGCGQYGALTLPDAPF
ncbi:hypothetical protein AXF42_Ash011508 [Apostasia shenzhenica]|uniref:Uncharacterized protein n=1 Tax=Apostasia shenzhenica TaxID=1088818 RepID=A0A2I0BAT7_9ASPA|nr:hypothetical protein AXF42_Ash011508 [Apostasia shenzhenica]